MRSSSGEVDTKAVAAHVLQVVLVRQWRDGDMRIMSEESAVEIGKVGKTSPDSKVVLLEHLEVGL